MNRLISWILNIVVGVFCFFLFLFFFFPFESVINHYFSKLEAQSGGIYRISVGEMDPGIIFKSVFTDFKIHKKADDKSEIMVDFPEVRIGLKYLPLMAGNLKASFSGKGKKGKLWGDFFISKTEIGGDMSLDQVGFSEFPVVSSALNVPLEGYMNGDIKLKIFPEDVTRYTGQADLKIVGFRIPASHITPVAGFELDLPDTQITGEKGGAVRIKMGKGRIEIEEMVLPGPDIAVDLKGRLQLNRRFSLSRLNLNGTFRISDKLREAFPLIMVVDKQKNEDGSYPLAVSGRFSRPQVKVGTMDLLGGDVL